MSRQDFMQHNRSFLRSISTKTLAVLFMFTALVFVWMVKPSPTSAQQSPNNTTVFSGQVIPAFVGTAYDPSYAYQKLAGLPIYVFAYDSWGGGANIINNLAIRTQIRVDGSFQAQGLPNGQNYGVYFPFAMVNGNLTRTDCGGGDPTPCVDGAAGVGIAQHDVHFRMPLPSNGDKIQDVFSYNMAEATQTVTTQLGEQIPLGWSFLTQEIKVDIANNTNTFPLVPTSTLRINAKDICHFLESCRSTTSEAYEIVAQKIIQHDPLSTVSDQLVTSPIISGRTTFPIRAEHTSAQSQRFMNDRNFQVYAPPGIYAITVWRNDGGITYSDYTTGGTIESTINGFGVIEVQENEADDWSAVLNRYNYIPVNHNKFTVWGVVLSPSGSVVKGSAGDGINVNITNTQYNSEYDTPLQAYPKERENECPSYGPWTYQNSFFYTNEGSVCADDPGIGKVDKVNNSFGVYAFFDKSENSVFSDINGFKERGSTFNVYLSGSYNGTAVSELPRTTEEILSTHGPYRLDLGTAARGNSHLEIQVLLPSLADGDKVFNAEALKLSVRHTPTGSGSSLPSNDQALKDYDKIADSRGFIRLPQDQFLSGVDYTFIFSYPNAQVAHIHLVPNPGDGSPPPTIEPIQLTQYTWNLIAARSKYKVFGFIPSNWVNTGTTGANDAFAQQACENGYAPYTINFKGADAYQSVKVARGGEAYMELAEDFLASQSGNWQYNFCLPYTDPEQVCDPEDAVVGQTESLRDVCLNTARSQNVFTVSATADGIDKSFTTVVQYRPEYLAPWPFATPSSIDAEFNDADVCEKSKQDLINKFEQRLKEEGDDSGGGWTLKKAWKAFTSSLSTFSDRLFQVTFPNWGCHMGNALSPLISNGIAAFRDKLIIKPLTTEPAVISGWNTIRGLSNVLFIFILMIIAINYILGVDRKTWSINALLPSLILNIILANASLLIVQAILDVNNILTSWIFSLTFSILEGSGLSAQGIGTAAGLGSIAAIGSFIGTLFSGGITGVLASAAASGGLSILPAFGLVLTILGTIFGFVITILAMLFGRSLIIWLVVITGSLFFALSSLPWTKSMRDLWWKTLIPIAFMQTIIAILMAVGVMLMSVSNEGGSIFANAGIFLAGGATLFSVLKSPQLAMSMLGGGGLAGQAMGAVSGAASKLGGVAGGIAGGAATGVASKLVGGLTEEQREERRIRDAQLKVTRPDLYGQAEGQGRFRSAVGRLGGALGGRQFAQARIGADLAESKKAKKIEKAAEAARDYRVEKGKLASQPGRTQRTKLASKLERETIPTLQTEAALKLKPVEADAMRAAVNLDWRSTEKVTMQVDEKGTKSTQTMAQHAQDALLKAAQKLGYDSSEDLDNMQKIFDNSGSLSGIGFNANKLFGGKYDAAKLSAEMEKNILTDFNRSVKANIVPEAGAKSAMERYNAGMRNRGLAKQAEGIKIPEPSPGKEE